MIMINCDIGERGSDHPVDRELMRHIQLANLACGGHAGDTESIKAFTQLAKKHAVKLSAHLSYPDRENFGRKSMDITDKTLLKSLDQQLSLLPTIRWVKFHGALYNDALTNKTLAQNLTQWLKKKRNNAYRDLPKL